MSWFDVRQGHQAVTDVLGPLFKGFPPFAPPLSDRVPLPALPGLISGGIKRLRRHPFHHISLVLARDTHRLRKVAVAPPELAGDKGDATPCSLSSSVGSDQAGFAVKSRRRRHRAGTIRIAVRERLLLQLPFRS